MEDQYVRPYSLPERQYDTDPNGRTEQDDYLSDRDFRADDGPKTVRFVRVFANEIPGQSAKPGAKPVAMAHFRILLVLDDNPVHPASVELNSMGVTATGDTKLVVSSRGWIVSNGRTPKLAEKDVHPVAGATLTVDKVLDLLVSKNRHHYKLHQSGSGCRYWTKVVLHDLIGVGYLPPGSDGVVDAMVTDILKVRPNVLMLTNAEGTFFP